MYDIIKVDDSTYYLDSPSRIGIYTPDGINAYAIDTGNGSTSGKKLLSAVSDLSLTLKAVFNTHSHGDHTGGNSLCQKRSGCKAYAPKLESYYTNSPELEPVYLFGGFAPKKLFHSSFTAAPSDCNILSASVLPEGLEIIALPGHSFEQVGYKTRTGVCFLGDSLVSEDTIKKYGVTVCYDIAAALNTLEKIKHLDGKLFIPSHAEPTSDIVPLANANINAIQNVISFILDSLKTAKGFDEILQTVFIKYNLEMNDAQHALIGFTLRSYLTYCENENLIKHYYKDCKMMWEKIT